jgi:hypothetical protein
VKACSTTNDLISLTKSRISTYIVQWLELVKWETAEPMPQSRRAAAMDGGGGQRTRAIALGEVMMFVLGAVNRDCECI